MPRVTPMTDEAVAVLEEAREANPGAGETLVLPEPQDPSAGISALRFDAGYPGEPLMAALEERGTHYVVRVRNNDRSKEIRKREKGVDPFACNQARLLLAGCGYQIMHVQRAVLDVHDRLEPAPLAERVLRTPARFTVSGRRITMITGGASAHWHILPLGPEPLFWPPDPPPPALAGCEWSLSPAP